MPAPKILAEAERDVRRAVTAARNLGSTATAGLEQAETIMAEVRHFAYSTAESMGLSSTADASRLLSAILGYQVTVLGVQAGFNDTDAYRRLAR